MSLPDKFRIDDHQPTKALGKGVNVWALRRLYELWPDAVVDVGHFNSRWDGVDLRITQIHIWRDPEDQVSRPSTHVWAEARCRLDYDVWDRRRGIALAFNRALKKVPR